MVLQFNHIAQNVSIYQKFVSHSNGRDYFPEVVTGDCGLSSKSSGLHRFVTGPLSFKAERWLSTTLDYALRSETRIEFLRLDIEGHEPQAWWGARQLFKRNIIRKAAVGCKNWQVKSFAETISNFSQLYDWGYNIECLDNPRTYARKNDWMELQDGGSCLCRDLGITFIGGKSTAGQEGCRAPIFASPERFREARRVAFILRTNKDTPFIRAQVANIGKQLRYCDGQNVSVLYLFHADNHRSEAVGSLREYLSSVGVGFFPFFMGNMTSVTGAKALGLTHARHFHWMFHEPSIVFWWKNTRAEYDYVWVQEDDAFFNGNLCKFLSHPELDGGWDFVSTGCFPSSPPPSYYDLQRNLSTWKVPLKRFKKTFENIVAYSARFLGVLQGFSCARLAALW
jgi:hypothetical protein